MKKIINNLEEVYVLNDNFVKYLHKNFLLKNFAGRKSILNEAEYMTLAMLKQELGFRKTKNFYFLIKSFFRKIFPVLPSYQQFNDGLRFCLPYLILLSLSIIKQNKKRSAKYYIVDSTSLPICANAYRYNLKIDHGLAKSGKNLNGWFFGFKAHLITNENLEIVGLTFSSGSVKDYDVLSGDFIKNLTGWMVGDKGYICSKKTKELAEKGLYLLTRNKSNMKKLPVTKFQNFLLSMREGIETVFSLLKHQLNMVATGAKSLISFWSQIFASILVYCICKTKKLKKCYFIEDFDGNLIS